MAAFGYCSLDSTPNIGGLAPIYGHANADGGSWRYCGRASPGHLTGKFDPNRSTADPGFWKRLSNKTRARGVLNIYSLSRSIFFANLLLATLRIVSAALRR
jgi:hypothetical protein